MPNEETPQEEQGTPETQEEEGDGQNQSNELETLKAQKQHWKEKYSKLEKEVEELKGQKEEPKKSNDSQEEPDYARLAFLEQRKVTHPDDQQIVFDEAKRLKLPLNDILAMDHIKSKLKDAKDQREAQDATPKGRGKGSGANKGDVEYWLARGETPSDDVELANKVINARMKKESDGNMFSDELYSG